MKFTAISFAVFTLISSGAFADKPRTIPNGATAIDSLPSELSASSRDSATRQTSSFDKTSQQRRRAFAPTSLEAPKANRSFDKHGAQKIKARSVIANPNS